jgi:hypothetical protein
MDALQFVKISSKKNDWRSTLRAAKVEGAHKREWRRNTSREYHKPAPSMVSNSSSSSSEPVVC